MFRHSMFRLSREIVLPFFFFFSLAALATGVSNIHQQDHRFGCLLKHFIDFCLPLKFPFRHQKHSKKEGYIL